MISQQHRLKSLLQFLSLVVLKSKDLHKCAKEAGFDSHQLLPNVLKML